jgi:hypothetical protein
VILAFSATSLSVVLHAKAVLLAHIMRSELAQHAFPAPLDFFRQLLLRGTTQYANRVPWDNLMMFLVSLRASTVAQVLMVTPQDE